VFGFSVEGDFVLQLAERVRFESKGDELICVAGTAEGENTFIAGRRGRNGSGLNLFDFGAIEKCAVQAEGELIRTFWFAINLEGKRSFVPDETFVLNVKIVADFAGLDIAERAFAKKTEKRRDGEQKHQAPTNALNEPFGSLVFSVDFDLQTVPLLLRFPHGTVVTRWARQ
jgi:hypothetical protein